MNLQYIFLFYLLSIPFLNRGQIKIGIILDGSLNTISTARDLKDLKYYSRGKLGVQTGFLAEIPIKKSIIFVPELL